MMVVTKNMKKKKKKNRIPVVFIILSVKNYMEVNSRGFDTLGRFSAICYKGNNFSDPSLRQL